MYIPPFTVSAEAINLIAEISGQIERYAIRLEQEDGLRLRKANRIKTIHSSLAIEGNTLTDDEVRDIIDGKNVVAPIKQIQEVKNAIATYELYPKLNPFSVKDLLKAHGVMMQALVDDAGKFRRSGVGVFSEHGLVHMVPPADRVPMLMDDLFGWLKESKDHLDKVPSEVPNKVPNKLRNKYPELSDAAWDVYTMIKGDTSITSKELGAALGISDRMVRKYISMLREANLIVRMGSNKTGYWKVNTVK